MKTINLNFNGTTCRMKSWRHLNGVQSACKTEVLEAHEPQARRVDSIWRIFDS